MNTEHSRGKEKKRGGGVENALCQPALSIFEANILHCGGRTGREETGEVCMDAQYKEAVLSKKCFLGH